MILGLVGHKQAGKDTVAKMIQYLESMKDGCKGVQIPLDKYLSDNILNASSLMEIYSGWQIKKFSTKLKQIVCILTGCTMEQLEDETFKNSLLPDRMQNPEKDRTYRWLMQYMGTEVGRAINENIWVDDLLSQYKSDNYQQNKTYSDSDLPNWIVADCRFQNEAAAIAKLGGVLIKINRGESTCSHKSEIELKSIPCDYIVENNGTILELYEKIKELWKKIKD